MLIVLSVIQFNRVRNRCCGSLEIRRLRITEIPHPRSLKFPTPERWWRAHEGSASSGGGLLDAGGV